MPRLLIHILLFACFALAACGQGVSDLMTEGDQYMKDGNYQGAIVIYKTVLEKAPETMEARLGLAKAYLGAGKAEQAEKNFEKYLRQNPYDKSVLLDMAKLSGFRKDNKTAIENLKAYLAEYPESSEAYELLGKNYWLMGDKLMSKSSFEKAIKIDPDGPTPKLGMAQFYMAEGQKEKAHDYIDAILDKDPTQKDALHYRARNQLEQGALEAYQATLKTILKNHPDDAYAKYVLAKSYVSQKDDAQALKLATELKMEAPASGYGQRVDGLLRYSNKEYKGAIDAYLEAIAIRPDVESYLYLGLSQYGAGDLETAISNLRIAADRSPRMVKAREMISLILFQQKRYNESIAEAEKVIAIDPENVIARGIKGDAYSAQGDADKALAQLKEITEKAPNYAAAFLKMGALHYAKGDISESEAAFKGAMKAAPDSLRPRLVLSDFYVRSGKKNLARKLLKEGLKGDKGDVAIYTYLARMELADRRGDEARQYLARAKDVDEANPIPYMMLASMALAEKKPEGALEEYEALLAKDGNHLRALLAKATLLDTLQRDEEAESVFKESLKSNKPEAFMAYASSKRKGRDLEGSLAIIKQGIAANPADTNLLKAKGDTLFALKRFDEVLAMSDEIETSNRQAAHSLRIRAYMLMNDMEKAIATGRQLTDFNPKDARGYLLLGEIYMRAKRMDDWAGVLEEGVAKCGPESSLLLELSRYHAATGDYNKSLTYLDSVIRSNDRFFRAHSMRGDIYNKIGRTEKAIDSYQKALELDATYVPALNNLAMIYLDDPKTASEALRLSYQAYLKAPWNASVMDTFGYALAVNGKKKEAVSVLEKAIQMEGENPTINYHLGYAYYKAEKKEQAVALLKPVADCADCEKADDARKLLNRIQ